MDQPDFDPYEVDADGLPLVYNEERIGAFWKGKPGMHIIVCMSSLGHIDMQNPHITSTCCVM